MALPYPPYTAEKHNFYDAEVPLLRTEYGQYAIIAAGINRPQDGVFESDPTTYRYYTLDEAKIEAAAWGGYLAEFTTQEELDAFTAFIKPEVDYIAEFSPQDFTLSSDKTPDGGGGAYGWIGATDKGSEGVWKWETSETSLSADFTGWGTNSPNDLNFDQDQAAFAFTSWSDGQSFGSFGKINDIDEDNISLVVIAEIPYYFDYGAGVPDFTKNWDWDGYEDTGNVYSNYQVEDDYGDDYWDDFDPYSEVVPDEVIPSVEALIRVTSDIENGTDNTLLYTDSFFNKTYFVDPEGGGVKLIAEENGAAKTGLSHEWNDGFGSSQNLRAITKTATGYLIGIEIQNNKNPDEEWRLYELDSNGVINYDSEYWGEIIGYESSFGQDLNGDGVIGIDISSFDNVSTDTTGHILFKDNEGHFYISTSTGDNVIRIGWEHGGAPNDLDRTESWLGGSDVQSTLAVEYSSSENLYYLARKNVYTYTDSYSGDTGTHTNWIVHKVSATGVLEHGDYGVNIVSYESKLNQDLDGDNYIGVDETKLTDILTDTSGATLKRGEDVLYIKEGDQLTAIRYGAGEFADLEKHDIHGPNNVFKKTAFAVNKNNDDSYTLILKNEDTNSGQTTIQYEIQGLYSDGKFNYDSQIYIPTIDGYETLFNQDLNNDGTVGIDTTDLTDVSTDTDTVDGGAKLKKSAGGAIFIIDGDKVITVTDPSGGIPTADTSQDFGDYGYELKAYAVQAVFVDGVKDHYKGLLRHTDWWGATDIDNASAENKRTSWEVAKITLDGVLDIGSNVWTERVYTYESTFQQDLDGDNVIGINAIFTLFEKDEAVASNGAENNNNDPYEVGLARDQAGTLYIHDPNLSNKISIKENLEENHIWDDGSSKSEVFAATINYGKILAGLGASSDDYYQVAVKKTNKWTDWQTGESNDDIGWQIYAIDSSGDIDWEKTIWTQSIADFETDAINGDKNGKFKEDLNEDGDYGVNHANLLEKEVEGDKLLYDPTNFTLYIVDSESAATVIITDEWGGTPRLDRSWQNNDGTVGKQTAVAVEGTAVSGYSLVVKNEGSDSRGSWLNYEIISIGADGIINWNETSWVEDITGLETLWGQDINGDLIKGIDTTSLVETKINQNGDILKKDSTNNKFYIEDENSGEHQLIVEEWGGAVNFDYNNSWTGGSHESKAFAVEDYLWTTIEGSEIQGYVVAVKHTSTYDSETHVDWQLNYIDSNGVLYNELRPHVGSIYDYEYATADGGIFGEDIDGDGETGLNTSNIQAVKNKNGEITDTNIYLDGAGNPDPTKNGVVELKKDSVSGALYFVDNSANSTKFIAIEDQHGGTPDFDYTYTRGTLGSSNYVLEESSAYAIESSRFYDDGTAQEYLLAVKRDETFGNTTKTYWETFQIENNGTQENPDWALDWNTASYSLGIGRKEAVFKQDMDGDNVIYNEDNVTTLAISTDTSIGGGLRAGLRKDSFDNLYIRLGNSDQAITDSNDSSISFDWTNYWGGQIHQSEAYAVEGIDTSSNGKPDKYKLAIKHTFTNDSSSQVDTHWQTIEIASDGRVNWSTETFGAGSIHESDLGQDLDGDGTTFNIATIDYQSIETDNVGAVPFLDNSNNLYIASTPDSNKYAVLDVDGSQINIDSYYYTFGDYSISQKVIAANENTISGTNKYQLLIESEETYSGTSTKSYQTINIDQSTYKIDWASYSNYEDVKKLEKPFDIDLDNDGSIYTVNTQVTNAISTDISGAKLRQTEDGSLVIKDGENQIILKYADGGFVDLNQSDTWTGGSYKSEAIAVQKVGNNYKIAVKETITSGDKNDVVYQVVCADSTGLIDWGKSVWQTPEELIEDIYGQDIDGDGVISKGTKSSLSDTVTKSNIDGEVLAQFSNIAQSDFFSITNADTNSTDAIEMFVKGVEGTAKATYIMDVAVIQEATDTVLSKVARDTGYDSTKIKPITDVMDFSVTIPDPDNYGKVVSLSWLLPEGTTNPKYYKKDATTGEYFDFIYDTESREGALWDASTNTLTVSVRDNGRYDSDPTLGIVRDPGFFGESSDTDDSSSGYDGTTLYKSDSNSNVSDAGKSYVKSVSNINLGGKDSSVCLYGGELATGSLITVKELTTKAQNNAPSGVTLNQNVLDFTVKTSTTDLAVTFGTDLVGDSISSTFKNADSRNTSARWSYSSIDSLGNVTDLSYDPVKTAGARFYDLVGNDGIADTVHLKLVDGGYGDKDGVVDGKIVDPSTAGVATLNTTFSVVDQYGLKLNDSSNATLEVNNVIKVTLDDNSLTTTSDQIGYWVQDASDITLTLAEIKTRAKTLFNTLESTDTTSITSSTELYDKEILLGNNQTAHFFIVSDGEISNVNKLEELNLIQATTADGTKATLTSTVGNVSLTATEITSDQGLDDLIGQYQDISPILDLESVPTNLGTISASIEVAREARIDSTIGFYKVINTSGDVLDSVTGNVVSTSASNYSSVALSSSNLVTELAGLRADDDTTSTSNVASIDDYSLLAPYASSGSETFFAFAGANSDGITHIKTLGNNIFGLEDIKGGGDLDYDDLVVRLDFNI